MELQVPPELEENLNRLAAQTGRTVIRSPWTCWRIPLSMTNGSTLKSKEAAFLPKKAGYSTTKKFVRA